MFLPLTFVTLILVVDEKVDSAALLKTIKKVGRDLVVDTIVFDIYQGEHIEKGYKSVAIRIVYQDSKKTLVESEVNAIHQSILSALEKEHKAVLRG